jgi:hypothetical protein
MLDAEPWPLPPDDVEAALPMRRGFFAFCPGAKSKKVAAVLRRD